MSVSIVVTDLDGTLLDSRHELRSIDRATLEALGAAGVLRVVATGRTLFSARRVLGADVPIDYLVHTSGAGVTSWRDGRLLNALHMEAPLASALAARLIALQQDFMLHHALPDNHRFFLHRASPHNSDFERRVELFAEHCTELDGASLQASPMCHAVVIEPPDVPSRHAELVRLLPEFRIIRATSPLDHRSRWFEIFPPGVGKSRASAWLRDRGFAGPGRSLAVGNDYNDVDLLEWADFPFVVANAPAELLRRFPNVASNDAGGFTEAVQRGFAAPGGEL